MYGLARQRAGVAQMQLHFDQQPVVLRELLQRLEASLPGLQADCLVDGELSEYYLISLDGDRFTRDGDESLEGVTRVLLLSADAGG